MRTLFFYQPVPTRKHIRSREAAFKARRMRVSDTWVYGKVVIGSRHEAHRIYGKQLITISRAFIDIPDIIVLYSFPRLLK